MHNDLVCIYIRLMGMRHGTYSFWTRVRLRFEAWNWHDPGAANLVFVHIIHERAPWHSRCMVTMETLLIEVRAHSFHGHVALHSNCVDTIEVVV